VFVCVWYVRGVCVYVCGVCGTCSVFGCVWYIYMCVCVGGVCVVLVWCVRVCVVCVCGVRVCVLCVCVCGVCVCVGV